MPRYYVNATMSVSAWCEVEGVRCEVEGVTPEDAMEAARELDAGEYDFDLGTAEIEFNVTPATELLDE